MLADAITDELLNKGLDKQEELDADLEAVDMMSDLGYDVKAYKDFIGNLSNQTEILNYKVKLGDSLSLISRNIYGDLHKWPKIFRFNKHKIKDPNLIFPNQQFGIPIKFSVDHLHHTLNHKRSRSMQVTHPSFESRVSAIDSKTINLVQKNKWLKKERFDAFTNE